MSDGSLESQRNEGSVPDRLFRHDQVLTDLERTTGQVLAELRSLRHEISARPTRIEQAVRRRISILMIAVFVYLAFQLNDFNSSVCSAGARARKGIDYVAHTRPKDFSNSHLQHLLNSRVPSSCDITFPIHAHNGDTWPTADNLIGLGICLILILLTLLWTQMPIWQQRWIDHNDPTTPPPPPWPGQE